MKVGEKYIIQIEQIIKSYGGEKLAKIKGFNALVFDQNGLNRLEKYKEHENVSNYEKKNNFKIGDEVCMHLVDNFIGIVSAIYLPDKMDVIYSDGSLSEYEFMEDWEKTGRSFPELEKMLKELQKDKKKMDGLL